MLADENTHDPEGQKHGTPGAAAMRHILVVDDDPAMRAMIADYLRSQNFTVSPVADGAGMSRVLRGAAVDLIILDMKLAHEDGLELMRWLGSPPVAPIIIVTGHRRDEADRVVGLELGADDYVTKPFSLRELLARIRAILRRSEAAGRHPRGKVRGYRFSGWELDMRTRRLTSSAGETLPLTAGEFNLLVAFLRSPQQVLSREQLLAASRLHDEEVFDRSIDVQILRLRRKLEANPSEPKLIVTERGTGYLFTTPVDMF
ncbi:MULTISPECIES: response regulator [unclassified Sinorhizobium]|uniref:response regulator n=1 Tax=unclassified Sinorhizobium TaxID=2613772 RepID=UPI0024C2A9F8|nr:MULTISPECIES: response regulator [unclassified Sinorhizobium]MDK1374123.1 response regulator [Sinorhizobium sp. 6-70]